MRGDTGMCDATSVEAKLVVVAFVSSSCFQLQPPASSLTSLSTDETLALPPRGTDRKLGNLRPHAKHARDLREGQL